MNLRPYQTDSVALLRQSFVKKHKRVILCLPTGSGKTVIFSKIAHATTERGKVTMVLVNRKELIKQAYNKCLTWGLKPTIIAPGHKRTPNTVYIASVDTLVRRALPEIDLLIVDECHIQTFDKILNLYPDVLTIGCTATPIRLTKSNPLHALYTDIIQPISISELIGLGYLAPALSYGAKKDFKDIAVKGGDYDPQSLFNAFDKASLYSGVVEQYKNHANGTKAICFNINIEHSIKMCAEFNQAGISAVHVDGSTPDAERARILKDFAEGQFQVLNNVAVLTTGFDEPSVQTIIVNRATKSLSLFLQICGRGSRPHPGKADFKIIDMGSNIYRHGFWEDNREFDLVPVSKKLTEGAAPVKNCPCCEKLLHLSKMVCDGVIYETGEACTYIFPAVERKLTAAEFALIPNAPLPTHLQRKWSEMPVNCLLELAELKGYKIGWVLHQLKKRDTKAVELGQASKFPEDLRTLAELKGYKSGWVQYQLRLVADEKAGITV